MIAGAALVGAWATLRFRSVKLGLALVITLGLLSWLLAWLPLEQPYGLKPGTETSFDFAIMSAGAARGEVLEGWVLGRRNPPPGLEPSVVRPFARRSGRSPGARCFACSVDADSTPVRRLLARAWRWRSGSLRRAHQRFHGCSRFFRFARYIQAFLASSTRRFSLQHRALR